MAKDTLMVGISRTYNRLLPGADNRFRRLSSLDAWIWICGLTIVAAMDPRSETHFTLFLPDLLFDIKSPGYGLGHSIGFLFRCNLVESLDANYLGLLVVLIIGHRIFHLFFRQPGLLILNREPNSPGG